MPEVTEEITLMAEDMILMPDLMPDLIWTIEHVLKKVEHVLWAVGHALRFIDSASCGRGPGGSSPQEAGEVWGPQSLND